MIHQLKIIPDHFHDVISGRKTFEVRRNDRDFHAGDLLALNEYDAVFGYTGRSCLVRTDYILQRENIEGGDFVSKYENCRDELEDALRMEAEPEDLEASEEGVALARWLRKRRRIGRRIVRLVRRIEHA